MDFGEGLGGIWANWQIYQMQSKRNGAFQFQMKAWTLAKKRERK